MKLANKPNQKVETWTQLNCTDLWSTWPEKQSSSPAKTRHETNTEWSTNSWAILCPYQILSVQDSRSLFKFSPMDSNRTSPISDKVSFPGTFAAEHASKPLSETKPRVALDVLMPHRDDRCFYQFEQDQYKVIQSVKAWQTAGEKTHAKSLLKSYPKTAPNLLRLCQQTSQQLLWYANAAGI